MRACYEDSIWPSSLSRSFLPSQSYTGISSQLPSLLYTSLILSMGNQRAFGLILLALPLTSLLHTEMCQHHSNAHAPASKRKGKGWRALHTSVCWMAPCSRIFFIHSSSLLVPNSLSSICLLAPSRRPWAPCLYLTLATQQPFSHKSKARMDGYKGRTYG